MVSLFRTGGSWEERGPGGVLHDPLGFADLKVLVQIKQSRTKQIEEMESEMDLSYFVKNF